MPQAADTQLQLADQSWQLKRYPARKHDPLRAWDAADELLLHEVQDKILPGQRVLIINDGFGALTTALAKHQPHWINDSYISQQACRQNLHGNGIDPDHIHWQQSLNWPALSFDWVLIKLPKSHAQLEDQLCRLSHCLHPKSKVIGAAMSKNMHSQSIKLFERHIGPSHTSLAKKKARLLFANPEHGNTQNSPYPKSYRLEPYQLDVFNHAAVFSHNKLDIGTHFFLQHFPCSDNYKHIIDLACGNGLLGLRAAQLHPGARIEFFDESEAAIATAKLNAEKNQIAHERLSFNLGNCLDGAKANCADLIINNPPFHQQHSISSHIAKQMFAQSRQVLKKGGELWVVGNRHLGYHKDLNTRFGNCDVVASNSKFVLLKATKQ